MMGIRKYKQRFLILDDKPSLQYYEQKNNKNIYKGKVNLKGIKVIQKGENHFHI